MVDPFYVQNVKSGLPVDDPSNFISPICIIEAFILFRKKREQKKEDEKENWKAGRWKV